MRNYTTLVSVKLSNAVGCGTPLHQLWLARFLLCFRPKIQSQVWNYLWNFHNHSFTTWLEYFKVASSIIKQDPDMVLNCVRPPFYCYFIYLLPLLCSLHRASDKWKIFIQFLPQLQFQPIPAGLCYDYATFIFKSNLQCSVTLLPQYFNDDDDGDSFNHAKSSTKSAKTFKRQFTPW